MPAYAQYPGEPHLTPVPVYGGQRPEISKHLPVDASDAFDASDASAASAAASGGVDASADRPSGLPSSGPPSVGDVTPPRSPSTTQSFPEHDVFDETQAPFVHVLIASHGTFVQSASSWIGRW